MVWEEVASPEVLPEFVAAGVMGLLALWLLYLDPRGHAALAFAAFLVLRAARMVSGALQDVMPDAGDAADWANVGPYYAIGSLGAIVAFAAVYPTPTG